MIIAVASGKGGTGKTTISVSLSLSLNRGTFIDCDTEEPNAYIFMHPVIEKKDLFGIPVPEIDFDKCDYCGDCAKVCEYNAIFVGKDNVMVINDLCHGCGACTMFCPQKAIKEVSYPTGDIETGNAGNIKFAMGRLHLGKAMATPIVRYLKRNFVNQNLTIIDSPPGTSCPVIESVQGSDFVILVTEPTPFGLSDLELAAGVVRELGLPFGVIINRSDIGDEGVENFLRMEHIPLLMKIPFNRKVAGGYAKGVPLIEIMPEMKGKFLRMYEEIKNWKK